MSRKEKNKKHNKKRSKKIIIVPLLSLIIIAGCIIYAYRWIKESNVNREVMEGLFEEVTKVHEETGETKIDFAKLKAKNKDTIGWLKVNNANVDYPVVKGTDNSYYIDHNFNGEANLAGWIFADYRDKGNGTDANLVIYGHNMKNGTMFGTLKKKMFASDWYDNEENRKITYTTEENIYTYTVFSIYEIPDESYFTTTSFTSTSARQQYINTMKSRSKKDFGITPKVTDKMLTLSTCGSTGNTRCIVQAVLTETKPTVEPTPTPVPTNKQTPKTPTTKTAN